MNYIDTINYEIKEYFNVLEPEFPNWLNDYINTDAMQHLRFISVSCGKNYTKLFKLKYYNSLDHSIGVALIIWHFTHDKKQTLSGLFHDISTPVFKHTIDFMNEDYMKQESTEDLTKKMISDSTQIMSLLERDGIDLEEICDYHIYPIADNDIPKLSADRLEYSLSNGYVVFNDINIEIVKKIYNDIVIKPNEDGIDEMTFMTKEIAEEFVRRTTDYSLRYRDCETRYSMQFIADIVKNMNKQGLLSIKDLYERKEKEVVELIEKCEYKDINKKFKIWANSDHVNITRHEPKGVYYVHHGAKIRYIDPLYQGIRISKVSKEANRLINENLNYDMSQYIYLDFEL